MTVRWLFADQLGPHFTEDADDDAPVLLVESLAAFRRRRFHRRKAHLVLSALRHRAAELGDRAVVVRAGTYSEALDRLPGLLAERGPATPGAPAAPDDDAPVSVVDPTSRAARGLVRRLAAQGTVVVLPERGWAVAPEEFAAWVASRGRRRLLLDDFYRHVRRATGLLVQQDGAPVGGRWTFDDENREPPPRRTVLLRDRVDVAEPWWPVEDEIDAGVRADLDRWEREGLVSFVGEDGPRRFAVTRAEALTALEEFVTGRLDAFGPYEDAVLHGDRWMAHSLLSVPLNLGLLHPLEAARRAVRAYDDGAARLASVEGFVRQVVGWREYVWHLYWQPPAERDDPDRDPGSDPAPATYRDRNALDAHEPLPDWWQDLDAGGTVRARCLSETLASVREEGWTHHIPRLMVLGNHALQRGYAPAAVTDWFHRSFVDGFDWVMVPNVVGMSQHADGGLMATKPYASGGAYLHRMTDHCGGCPFDPKVRLGPRACPFTAGYWAFLHRNAERFAGNHRMGQALAGLRRLDDLDAVVEQEARRDRF
nr:cryptochrome/photolyase family protein [uncultured Actinotalea sp.]